MNLPAIQRVFDAAAASGRDTLLETEGLDVLAALGLPTPAHVFVAPSAPITAATLAPLPGTRVVVKVISPRILHKSDVGGVAIVDRNPAAVAAAIADMHRRLGQGSRASDPSSWHPDSAGRDSAPAEAGAHDRSASQHTRSPGPGSLDVAGYTISEFIAYPPALGHELIVGLRWTDDVGPVVSVGAGGIYTEFLSGHFKPGHDIAVFSPALDAPGAVPAALGEVAVVQLMTQPLRGQPPRLAMDALTTVVDAFLALARAYGDRLAECEVNPFVVTADGRLVALDVLVRLGRHGAPAAPRPLHKLARLLRPASVAIMGVSERMNPGHIIVNNLIREGFDRSRILIVKPGSGAIEGCRCVPSIADLPERVDLFVLAVDAAQASHALGEIIERRAAESIILIPGGLEEKAGSEAVVARMREALARARATDWGGPLINGGNCLGIRSLPGRYDTTFIPEYKFPVPAGRPSRVVYISQSGAFALAKTNKLGVLNPKYSVTLGNQMDLTVGDYLTFLQDDADVDVFAVYVEGFRPLDGLRFLEAAGRITASGRTVILYRAGRTPAGAAASASHTASIAGDYAVLRALCRHAGVIVADTLEDFEDLTLLFTMLGPEVSAGWRLGAVSNAGYECVAVADNLGRFSLPAFGEATSRRLAGVFAASRIAQVVDVHNPIDLTPMTGDAGYVATVETLLQDPEIDVVVVGCVPFTAALQTLPPANHHGEDLDAASGIVPGLIRLRASYAKPWVAVVDAGPLYDAMAGALLSGGIPTFRAADRALRLLNVYCESGRRR